jgi:uncharacterized protein
LVDEDKRPFYKKFQDSDSPLNKILIKVDRETVDLSMLSSIVSSAESFEMNRVYLKRDDTEGLTVVNGILN